jgi:hypothetical protein
MAAWLLSLDKPLLFAIFSVQEYGSIGPNRASIFVFSAYDQIID